MWGDIKPTRWCSCVIERRLGGLTSPAFSIRCSPGANPWKVFQFRIIFVKISMIRLVAPSRSISKLNIMNNSQWLNTQYRTRCRTPCRNLISLLLIPILIHSQYTWLPYAWSRPKGMPSHYGFPAKASSLWAASSLLRSGTVHADNT